MIFCERLLPKKNVISTKMFKMFLAAETDGSRLFCSLMNKIQTIIYKIECSLLVLVDRGLKRCRDLSLAKPRSDQ